MSDVLKAVAFVLTPSNLIGLIAAVGLLCLLVRRRSFGVGLLVVAVASLVLAGWSPLGRVLLLPLENRFPQPMLGDRIAGIVVLGGAEEAALTVTRGQATLNQAGERILMAATLAGRFPDARVVLAGGGDLATSPPMSEAAVARDLLVALGVESARLVLDEASRDTCENAQRSLGIARPMAGELWLLVTSASHMPRAVACFRASDFAVLPFPVDYRTRGASDLWRPAESIADGLSAMDVAVHEWIGLAAYRLLGRTDALFPGPESAIP